MSDEPQAPSEALPRLMSAIADTMSDEEALNRYQALMAQIPPEAAAQVNAMAFNQLSLPDRRQLAAQFQAAHQDPNRPFTGFAFADVDEAAQPLNLGMMAQQAARQDPSLSESVMGGNSGMLGSPLVKFVLAALAIYVLSRLQTEQQSTPAAPGQGDMLGSLLGSLLGGMLAQAGGAAQGPPARQSADPLGQILGGLLGGGAAQEGRLDLSDLKIGIEHARKEKE